MSTSANDIVARLAERQLGPTPGAPPAAAAPPGGPPAVPAQVAAKLQPPQPQAPNPATSGDVPDTPTAQDAASTAGAPVDESKAMGADPILYEVDFGGSKRKLTPQQIVNTFERYRDLNFDHARLKPAIDVIKNILKSNPNISADQLARTMDSIAKAEQKSPTQGNANASNTAAAGTPANPSANPGTSQSHEDALAAWERDNSATLPPGYKDLMSGNQSIQQQLAQTQALLRQVLAGTQGVADASRTAQGDARSQQVSAIRQQIGNNLNGAQQQLQLPDDAAQDFMTFAAERGYSMEDFVDPRLTYNVMQDFANNRASPEMARLKEIAQRRQAFTGTMGSSGAGPAAPAAPPPATPLDGMVSRAMGNKFLQ
jgi:hypothetical protein